MKRWLVQAKNGQDYTRKRSHVESSLKAWGTPRKIIAWNVENLVSRARQNRDEVEAFFRTCEADVIFLSEVKLAAVPCTSNAKRGDGSKRRRWEPKRGCDKRTDEEMRLVDILFKNVSDMYRDPMFSLSDWRYAGSCILLKRNSPIPRRVWFDLVIPATEGTEAMVVDHKVHEGDGRVICCDFETFWLLHTYAPNNGSDGDAFERRLRWETRVRGFVSAAPKPIVYIGDLNVAPDDRDLSHPEWFRAMNSNSRRFGNPPFKTPTLDPKHVGQPGCTDAEREHFAALLEAGNFVDAFRDSRPDPKADIDLPLFSWRGPAGRDGDPRSGRYYSKGMRIDHALVHKSIPFIDCDLLGSSKDRLGFMGSDHCPIRLRL